MCEKRYHGVACGLDYQPYYQNMATVPAGCNKDICWVHLAGSSLGHSVQLLDQCYWYCNVCVSRVFCLTLNFETCTWGQTAYLGSMGYILYNIYPVCSTWTGTAKETWQHFLSNTTVLDKQLIELPWSPRVYSMMRKLHVNRKREVVGMCVCACVLSQGSNSEHCSLSDFIFPFNFDFFVVLAVTPTNHDHILLKSRIAGTKSSSREEKEDRCTICLTG